jgi:uncharacterized protein (TIGR00252 family)
MISSLHKVSFSRPSVVTAHESPEQLPQPPAEEASQLSAQGGEVIYSNPKSPASVITERLASFGNTTLTDTILGTPFRYATEGFFQVNIPVYEQALRDMSRYTKRVARGGAAPTPSRACERGVGADRATGPEDSDLRAEHALASAGNDGSGRRTTKSIGDRAENVVAEYLESQGHTILARNWKTKICEIDIVSQLDDTIYFTEVKYRKNANYGDGLAAITGRKLRQMKFAAEYYALKHKYDGSIQLAAASVSGSEFTIEQWLILE